ncbi:DUF2786 domain-containing protein [Saccharothrix coeruleofusca]|uniref:DUF2786 domain-containing protein n=1 Tax=Saccharothrix coeruleofusca TaxID=33919 RepID=A0A918AJ30_9PSEU|nr:DUF2786 domain-containing protein [Saccharothrix coeruleofusca]GGP43793.1 hypothetical protein GCM10010185_14360 [Saccharothrix coeruleofusca]
MESLRQAMWRAAANRRAPLPRTSELSATEVDDAARAVLRRAFDHLWGNGWLPYDVHEVVRRNEDDRVLSFLVDSLAADAERFPVLHPRWREQLAEVGAEVWWDRDQPHLDQWATRHIERRDDAVAVVVALLARLMTLPALPRIIPEPGSPLAEVDHHGVDRKVLNRVRGLLAKAESTPFPEEAEALSAKAQELVNRHALQRMPTEAPAATSRRMWLDKRYFDGKAHIVHVVAEANRARAVVYDDLGFVALVGEELDLEIVELLSTSLLVQATRAMVAAGDGAPKGDETRSLGYRKSFLLSYAHRVGERLRAVNQVDDDRLLPVLAQRKKAVDELFGTLFASTTSKSTRVRSAAGWDAGRAAADRADLSVDR